MLKNTILLKIKQNKLLAVGIQWREKSHLLCVFGWPARWCDPLGGELRYNPQSSDLSTRPNKVVAEPDEDLE
jgi:hypothetical protein